MSGKSSLTLRLDAYAATARSYVEAAQALADRRDHAEVLPSHLWAVLLEKDAALGDALKALSAEPAHVVLELELLLRKLPARSSGVAYLSASMLDTLAAAEGESSRAGGAAVDARALVLASAQQPDKGLAAVLKACGVSAPLLRAVYGNDDGAPAEKSAAHAQRAGLPAALADAGRDLTRQAREGRLPPVVGRADELRRVLQVLARTRANNPLLVGERGVGRSALVEALSSRIARGDVPEAWRDRHVLELDLSGVLAGAKLRGEAEQRTRTLLDAVRDAAGGVLLFLPSLGPLTSDRAGASAQLLAGALQRRELQCIARAAPDEVRALQEQDRDLFEAFVPIDVEPPTHEQAVAILRGRVEGLEVAHGVGISDPALVAAARLSRRYVPSAQLPAAALDLIDEAAARVRVQMDSVPEPIDRLEQRLSDVELERRSLSDETDAASRAALKELDAEVERLTPQLSAQRERWHNARERSARAQQLKQELQSARSEHERALAVQDTDRAGELQFGTLAKLERELSEAQDALTDEDRALLRDTVTEHDAADVVALWTGVPVSRMLEDEQRKLLAMEERLSLRVKGQASALEAVSRAVRRGRVGLRDPGRPIGSFMFLGPTGVGKTELAKALAEFLFDDEHALTRLDMSEFMEKQAVARLLGSPPGYVDSDQGGFLTEAVRRRPYSVVLFDEVEKAHPDVFDILLQVLDDGRLSDARGRPAHFADTVIILTSNLGGRAILDHQGDEQSLRDKVMDAVEGHFRPEFLNRIDEQVIFNALGKPQLAGIAEVLLSRVARLLQPQQLTLDVQPDAKAHLVDLGFEPAYGARPLRRAIQRHLQDPLAERLLSGEFSEGDRIVVKLQGDKLAFSRG